LGRGSGWASSSSATDSERHATTGYTDNSTASGHDHAGHSEYVNDADVSDRTADHGYDARGRGRHASGANTDYPTDSSCRSNSGNAWRDAACDTAASSNSGPGTGTVCSCAGDRAAERVDHNSGFEHERFDNSALELNHNAGKHAAESGAESDCAMSCGNV